MSQDYENIEAQLAAYIDGELSPAERAEIEKHLAANPVHAAMIRELSSHKQMVAALPRVVAPSDLSDELQSQLEREVLLGDPVLLERPGLLARLFARPQLLAAAAVLVLASGLGVGVWMVLPGRAPIAINAPLNPSPDQPHELKSRDAEPLATTSGTGLERSDLENRIGRQTPDAALRPSPERGAMRASRLAEKAAEPLRQLVRTAPPVIAGEASPQDVTLAIRTPDVDQANGAVLEFLADNEIPWSLADHDTARPGAQQTVAAPATLKKLPEQLVRAQGTIADRARKVDVAEPVPATGSDALVAAPPAPAAAPGGAALALQKDREAEKVADEFDRKIAVDHATVNLGETLDENKLAGTATLSDYTNQLARADRRIIHARGLTSAQLDRLAMLFEQTGPATEPARAESRLAFGAPSPTRGRTATSRPAPLTTLAAGSARADAATDFGMASAGAGMGGFGGTAARRAGGVRGAAPSKSLATTRPIDKNVDSLSLARQKLEAGRAYELPVTLDAAATTRPALAGLGGVRYDVTIVLEPAATAFTRAGLAPQDAPAQTPASAPALVASEPAEKEAGAATRPASPAAPETGVPAGPDAPVPPPH